MKVLLLSMVFLFLGACGMGESHEHPDPAPAPPAAVTPPPVGGISWLADAKPIIDNKCAGCHPTSDFVQSESGYVNNQSVKNKLANKQMPPKTAAKQLTDQELAILLDETFFL